MEQLNECLENVSGKILDYIKNEYNKNNYIDIVAQNDIKKIIAEEITEVYKDKKEDIINCIQNIKDYIKTMKYITEDIVDIIEPNQI